MELYGTLWSDNADMARSIRQREKVDSFRKLSTYVGISANYFRTENNKN